jgi:hypothetical protein
MDIWHALTDSSVLTQWFPADLQGERAAGQSIEIVSVQGRFPPAKGKFNAYEAGRYLEYTWDGELLCWDLQSTDSGTLLVFLNVLDAKAISTSIENIASAWHACLDVLSFVLSRQQPPYTADERFIQISDRYAGLLGAPSKDA